MKLDTVEICQGDDKNVIKRWGGGGYGARFHCTTPTNAPNHPHLTVLFPFTSYSGLKKALFFELNHWYHTEAASIRLLNHLCWRKKIIWMISWPLFFQNLRFHFDIGLWTRCASIRSVLSNCSKKLAIEFFWYFVYLLVVQRWDVIKSKRSQYLYCFTS